MGKFLDLFPRTLYKLDGGKYSSFDTVTNITFRVGLVRETMSNFAAYYEYVVRDGETPESLADRVYGDPQGHWVILYANNIYDPFYDWPLDYKSFNAYIIDKYGSIESAQTTYHHFEKVVTRENATDNVTTVERFRVTQYNPINTYSALFDDVPIDTYTSLETAPVPINLSVGNKTVIETVERNAVSNYDWEREENDAKRNIKIIKKEYYSLILSEFDKLTDGVRNPFMRRLV